MATAALAVALPLAGWHSPKWLAWMAAKLLARRHAIVEQRKAMAKLHEEFDPEGRS